MVTRTKYMYKLSMSRWLPVPSTCANSVWADGYPYQVYVQTQYEPMVTRTKYYVQTQYEPMVTRTKYYVQTQNEPMVTRTKYYVQTQYELINLNVNNRAPHSALIEIIFELNICLVRTGS